MSLGRYHGSSPSRVLRLFVVPLRVRAFVSGGWFLMPNQFRALAPWECVLAGVTWAVVLAVSVFYFYCLVA